jgi:hypothetical protein
LDDGGKARDNYEARYILVRPDHFVTWASEEPPLSARRILAQATGSSQ